MAGSVRGSRCLGPTGPQYPPLQAGSRRQGLGQSELPADTRHESPAGKAVCMCVHVYAHVCMCRRRAEARDPKIFILDAELSSEVQCD